MSTQAEKQVPTAESAVGPSNVSPGPALRPFEIPPTPKVISDQWVTMDTLGYEAYARTLANLITHPDTKPPLTIGIEAPWGAGKTSVMKMIQHILDGEAHLTEQNEAGKKNRRAESEINIRTLLEVLRHPDSDTRIQPKQSSLGERYDVPGRATVWFNAWKYQTSEQVWAGLAHCIINHVTVRMNPGQRELFWLRLNSRRVDVNAVRRKVYDTLLHDLLPRVFGWAVALVLLLVIVAGFLFLGGTGVYPLLARALHWASPVAAAVAGIDLWRKWKTSVNSKLQEKVRGDLLKLVREPDYEGKMGFLYLVESDVREVLDLVATSETPLLIFIDDLDRCMPHKVAEVVEAVSLFLAGDYPNCIFVMGMEPHVVAAALEVANSDVIKRMEDIGAGDESAPMGWRFMEKIIQLPLVLPPPTRSGMTTYLNALAPPERQTEAVPVSSPPDEAQVQNYIQALSKQGSLSDVVTRTEQLLADIGEGDTTAIAEASKRVFFRKFDERDPLVRKFLESAIEVFGANPRQIKRYVNLFRLCCNLRHSIWLDSVAAKSAVDLPMDEQITKFVAFSVQWPQATSLLRRSSGEPGADIRESRSVLAFLEQTAVQLESEASVSDEKWAAVLKQTNLADSLWAKSSGFRRYLATGAALSAALNKGLW